MIETLGIIGGVLFLLIVVVGVIIGGLLYAISESMKH